LANIKVSIERLQPGMYIHLPLKWNEHPFLLNRFKIKDHKQLAIIRQLGLVFVYYNSSLSDVLPASPFEGSVSTTDVDTKALEFNMDDMWERKKNRIEAFSAYQRRLNRCQQNFERSIRRLRGVFKKAKIRPQESLVELGELVDEIVDEFLHNNSVTLHLVNSGEQFEDIHLHSLNVAIIAMMIAKAKNSDDTFIRDVAYAALIHDMGKVKIPFYILNKKTELTPPEENYLKQHIKYGLDMVKDLDTCPSLAKIVIEQHHEFIDGSGYPNGLTQEQIDPAALIVAVSNAFDSLCHPPIPANKRVPHAALSYMYKFGKTKYDLENLAILIKLMGVYPPGTIVELSNKMIGIVVSANSEKSLAPEVLLYDETVPRHQATVIDIAQKDLTILKVIAPNKLSDDVKEYLNPSSRISYFFSSDK
jgi:HD-GYP domain-containing protein (c-di-GMP phosphodiesterase class II)